MNNKIGVGVVTYNREDFCRNCLSSIPAVDELVVVNDGTPYSPDTYPKHATVIQHDTNLCVGVSKNDALKHLIAKGCTHLFLIEDDMTIIDSTVFEKYIHAAEASGIWHLNFGYHGTGNMKDGKPYARQTVDYKDALIALNVNCVGSFSYYLRGVIEHVGLMDERFNNAWEHVDHTYRIIKAGLHPPFWYFADVADSYTMIKDYGDKNTSSITLRPDWSSNIHTGAALYKSIHGVMPQHTPDTHPDKVFNILRDIKTKYSRKLL